MSSRGVTTAVTPGDARGKALSKALGTALDELKVFIPPPIQSIITQFSGPKGMRTLQRARPITFFSAAYADRVCRCRLCRSAATLCLCLSVSVCSSCEGHMDGRSRFAG
jgi:hypothetical protein